ncbi:putative ABC transporter ATP-binding protein YbhF [Planctomycetes bacterium Poly30]|uniref:Putative ABC transporter ATP-binding protein YbhF n=1 Tax=Saltatorellus ferox TaxID=2528018 RepID=A0A518EV95_9BACT|nr:putative ABC transporter ATP-binding protein YbhF [Planctomycetes bacterium Poly30]
MTESTNPGHGAAIFADGLKKTFRDPQRGVVEAVRGVDLDCQPGEIYGLLGPNGAGKTTTLRMLSTILAPTSGRAVIDGIDVAKDPLEVRRRIGFLSGSTGLYPRLTGRETLRYFGKLHGLEGDALEASIQRAIEDFDLSKFADGRCETLSTGQKQRVSIARAVVHDPPVLILDEPTTGLDIMASSDMIKFIESRREAGRCVLFSTHILSEAERLCDRIGVVYSGRMLAHGTLDELRADTGKEWLEDVFLALVQRADAEAVVTAAGASASSGESDA